MYKTYSFQKDGWKKDDFLYCYSPICREFKQFEQEDFCIVNGTSESTGKFDYISLLTKEKFHKGTVVETRCSFEKYGAPLIVLSDDIHQNKDGNWKYGLHFEAVGYENGVNVWRIQAAGEDAVDNTNLIRQKFHVEAGKGFLLRIKVEDSGFDVSLDSERFYVKADFIPEEFHAGITACEGINRFYELTVSE